MTVTAATFSDPSMRSSLEKYYESKKAEVIAAFKARQDDTAEDVTFTTPEGHTLTGKRLITSAEQLEKAFVNFDTWLEIQKSSYSMHEKIEDMAKKRLDMLKANSPDSPSNVASTFANDGVLLAYVNSDGTLVTSATASHLASLAQKADDLGFSGQSRVDYLTRELEKALSRQYPDLAVTRYDEGSSPSKRDFAKMWYPHYDADKQYADSLKEAEESVRDREIWNQQWRKNANELQNFLLKIQGQMAA